MDKVKAKIENVTFVSEAGGMGKRFFPERKRRKAKRGGPYAASMMAKIALCALACAGALIVKLHDPQNISDIAEAGAEDQTDKLDEMLGKLQFVELPGILEVIAPPQLLTLPANGKITLAADNDSLLCIAADSEQYVYARLGGKIKQIGQDTEKGLFVSISDGETELNCYGLSSVSVEEGQPVDAADSIGNIQAGSILYIETKVNGRPVEPSSRFDIEKQA